MPLVKSNTIVTDDFVQVADEASNCRDGADAAFRQRAFWSIRKAC